MFAGHISVTSILAKHEPAGTLVFIQMFTGSALSLAFTLILGEDKALSVPSFMAIVYLGIFSTMLAFFLQTVGQKYAHATKAAIFLSLESLFGAIFAVLIFHDHFTTKMTFGAIIIFIAILIAESNLKFLTKW